MPQTLFTIGYKVKHQGVPLEKILKRLTEAKKEFEPELNKIASVLSKKIGDIIDQNRKRPRKRGKKGLANAFRSGELKGKVKRLKDVISIGIGNINYLNSKYPYWRVLNWGGYIPPANLGYFVGSGEPREGKSRERWEHTGDRKDFFMRPKKPISPVNYIEKANDWFKPIWDKVWTQFTAKQAGVPKKFLV